MGFPVITPLSIRLGVVGAGTMGSGIALAALLQDVPVNLYDISPEMLAHAAEYLQNHLARKNKPGNLRLLTKTSRLEELSGCNLVIEAAPEKLELKTEIFERLDRICPSPAILATNTSTLSVTAIAAVTSAPQRVIGMHFFNPAAVLPLVEIIQGPQTAPEVVKTAFEIAEKLGKTPILAKDVPGFIVNRVARPFYGEALRLAGEGTAAFEQIDWLARLGAGFRMGPFELMDLIGIDTNYAAMHSMYEQTWGESRYRPHHIQQQKVEQKTLGRKSGRGFYEYTSEASGPHLPEVPHATNSPAAVLVAPGSWAPGLMPALKAGGFRLLGEQIYAESRMAAAFLPAGRGENMPEKLAELELRVSPDVPVFVQACDTTLAEAAGWASHPERLIGFDSLFFASGQAIELTAGPWTKEEFRTAAVQLVRGLGKVPVWIGDSPSLVLPRLIAMLANEAAFAVLEAVAEGDQIDRAMQLGVNYPKGPLAWGRELGLEKVLAILDHLFGEYHEERYRAAPNLRQWVRSGQLQNRLATGG